MAVKKAAKEKAAELALGWLEKQDVPKKVTKDLVLPPLAASKVDPSENWVGVSHGRSEMPSMVSLLILVFREKGM
jgi:hypothetical protein